MLPCLLNNGGDIPPTKSAHVMQSKPWLHQSLNYYFCAAPPLFSGIFSRKVVQVLVDDSVARLAYLFWSIRGAAAVEHYYNSVFATLIRSNILNIEDFYHSEPCVMSWVRGLEADGTHNTVLTTSELDIIQDARQQCIPFARKMRLEQSRDLLDVIDGESNLHCI